MDAKAKFGMMMVAGMAMTSSMESERWGKSRNYRVGGEPRVKARSDKKKRRKIKKDSQLKNRKK